MRDLLHSLIVLSIFVVPGVAVAAPGDAFKSCGAGWVLGTHKDVDGIDAAECKKLWCRDLENGKVMGSGNAPAAGYRATSNYVTMEDADGNTIDCWGERKWCAGETPGVWNPEYGAYTRGGDNTTYLSYQKGSCFAWRLEKPSCGEGETAVLQKGQWVCATSSGAAVGTRAAAVRRTGTVRRVK